MDKIDWTKPIETIAVDVNGANVPAQYVRTLRTSNKCRHVIVWKNYGEEFVETCDDFGFRYHAHLPKIKPFIRNVVPPLVLYGIKGVTRSWGQTQLPTDTHRIVLKSDDLHRLMTPIGGSQ